MAAKITQSEFIRRAKAVHGENYDLAQTVYRSYNTPVDVICAKHGMFSVRASHF